LISYLVILVDFLFLLQNYKNFLKQHFIFLFLLVFTCFSFTALGATPSFFEHEFL